MGNRIHVAKTYEVKYADSEAFCNRKEAVNHFLYENCPNMAWEGESAEYSEVIEIPRSDLANLIGKIITNRKYYEDWAQSHKIEESADQFITILAQWISQSDQRNDFVILSWY